MIIWLRFLLLIASVFCCQYIQEIPVRYTRFASRHVGKLYLSDCISDQSMGIELIKTIAVECEASKLPELKANFISNMTRLESISIKDCNTSKIHAGSFASLPKLTSIRIEFNHLSHIPKGLFDNLPSLSQISMTDNNISSIESEAFANLANLTSINLSRNNLKQMEKSWFTNTTNVKYFFINKNQLEEVPEGMFKDSPKAMWFDLSFNNISAIHKDAFKNAKSSINLINLDANRLQEINFDAFPAGFITQLSINGNLLNYFSNSFVRNIKVRQLNVIGNPWKCPCLSRIYEIRSDPKVWLSCGGFCQEKCRKNTIPVCANPSGPSTKCEESVDEEVTTKLADYMKQQGFKDLRDWAIQCLP